MLKPTSPLTRNLLACLLVVIIFGLFAVLGILHLKGWLP